MEFAVVAAKHDGGAYQLAELDTFAEATARADQAATDSAGDAIGATFYVYWGLRKVYAASWQHDGLRTERIR